MKLKRETLLTAFFKGESEHKRKRIEMMENQNLRMARQQKFNYGTRQAAKVVWGKDHRKLEIFRYDRRLSNYRLIGKTGRRWLYGRGCIRLGSPIRAMSLTNRFRMRFGYACESHFDGFMGILCAECKTEACPNCGTCHCGYLGDYR